MAKRAALAVLTAALALAAASARAQPTPLRSADTPQSTAPATVLPTPTPGSLPEVGTPAAIAAPPATIDDILDQSTDVEPDDAPPAPPADYGLTSEQLDARIRGASAAAQVLQGPMDGAWELVTQGGEALYTFLFVDSARPTASLEGAWRDLKRGEGLSGTGLIASLMRTENLFQASFYPKGGQETAALSLIQDGGGWTGQLVQGGLTTPVRMIRNEPMLNVAPMRVAGAGVVSPYRSAAANRAAPARKVVKKKAVRKKAAAKKGARKASAKKATIRKKRA